MAYNDAIEHRHIHTPLHILEEINYIKKLVCLLIQVIFYLVFLSHQVSVLNEGHKYYLYIARCISMVVTGTSIKSIFSFLKSKIENVLERLIPGAIIVTPLIRNRNSYTGNSYLLVCGGA